MEEDPLDLQCPQTRETPELHYFLFLPIVHHMSVRTSSRVCVFYTPAGEPRFSSSFMDLAKMQTNATADRSHGTKDD